MRSDRLTERVASLDLLRGVAALSVAIPHYLALGASGWSGAETVAILAVELFFVLSGFVLAPQILYCVRTGQIASIRVFLVRRWMRTIPPYVVALIAMSVVTSQFNFADFMRYAFYVQNLIGQHNAQDYFPVAWSLSVEEWFYVTVPLALWGASRFFGYTSPTFCALAAVAFIVAISIIRMVFGDFGHWDVNVRRVVLFRLDSIAVGFVLYVILQEASRSRWLTSFLGAGSAWPWLLFIASSIAAYALTEATTGIGWPSSRSLYPLGAAAFGVAAVLLFYSLRAVAARSRFWRRFCEQMAAMSYSIYLFHLLFAMILKPLLLQFGTATQLAIYLCALFGAATLFYRYFERPILDARPRYKHKNDALDDGVAGASS